MAKLASFGPPIDKQIPGGMHITFEIILKKDGKYIAFRHEGIPGHVNPPGKKLYFCHDLIFYGESTEDCIARIVKAQAGVTIKNFKIVYLESLVQEKDGQWAVVPYVFAEVEHMPKSTDDVEVVTFDKQSIPDDFAWWTLAEIKEFLDEFD